MNEQLENELKELARKGCQNCFLQDCVYPDCVPRAKEIREELDNDINN
jgi:hypothetical protein